MMGFVFLLTFVIGQLTRFGDLPISIDQQLLDQLHQLQQHDQLQMSLYEEFFFTFYAYVHYILYVGCVVLSIALQCKEDNYNIFH